MTAENKTMVLDLCCGLGGFSQAFQNDPRYFVITVDIEPRFRPTLVWDVTDVPGLLQAIDMLDKPKETFDLILCSPPCIEFARIGMPWIKYDKTEPDMSIVLACKKIISTFNPPFWVMENTMHGKKWICPLIGDYRIKLGPYYFWGEFPLFDCHVEWKKNKDVWSTNPDRSAIRAKLPMELSMALRNASENQTTLMGWLEFVEG